MKLFCQRGSANGGGPFVRSRSQHAGVCHIVRERERYRGAERTGHAMSLTKVECVGMTLGLRGYIWDTPCIPAEFGNRRATREQIVEMYVTEAALIDMGSINSSPSNVTSFSCVFFSVFLYDKNDSNKHETN